MARSWPRALQSWGDPFGDNSDLIYTSAPICDFHILEVCCNVSGADDALRRQHEAAFLERFHNSTPPAGPMFPGDMPSGDFWVREPGLLIFSEEIPAWDRPLPRSVQVATQGLGYAALALTLLGLMKLLWKQRLPRLPRPPVPHAFEKKLLEVKVGQLRILVQTACCLLLPLTAWLPHAVWLEGQRMAPAVNLMQTALGCLTFWPEWVSISSLDSIFLGFVLLLAAAVSPVLTTSSELPYILLLSNSLFAAFVFVRRTRESRCWLLLLAAAAFGGTSSTTTYMRGEMMFGTGKVVAVAAQATFVLGVIVAAPLLERLSRHRTMQLLEIEELRELLNASRSLLRSCFDVVVELDEKMEVVGGGRELGALLLRHQELGGASFLSLLEGGREAAAERLRSADAGVAEGMQVAMKDACQNVLRLEAMWFGFTRPGDESRRIMMGLKECSGEREPPQALEGIAMTNALHEDSASEGSEAFDEAVIVVNEKAEVLESSAAFRKRVGRLGRGKSLLEVLARPRDFKKWREEALQSGKARVALEVALKMPQGKVWARCSAREPLLRERTRLRFEDIRLEAEERPKRPEQSRGTSPSSSSESLGTKGSLPETQERRRGRRRGRDRGRPRRMKL